MINFLTLKITKYNLLQILLSTIVCLSLLLLIQCKYTVEETLIIVNEDGSFSLASEDQEVSENDADATFSSEYNDEIESIVKNNVKEVSA